MSLIVWVNEFTEGARTGIERSIPYSSRRAALRAREAQPNRTFIGEPIELVFEASSPEPIRCEDCPYSDEPCVMCFE